MRKLIRRCGLFCIAAFVCCGRPATADDVADALLFRASFDKSIDADYAKGDSRLYTAESTKREKVQVGIQGDAVSHERSGGKHGGALRFHAKQAPVLFYKGGDNVPYSKQNFQGTISFWMRLTPAEDLPPGYVDPLQITDKAWNNSSFFVDFTQTNPRQFRLGVFSDYKFWNPTDRKWDDIPDAERPMVTITDLPFSQERWTHVAFVFGGFNRDQPGVATLYLDGVDQGSVEGKQQYHWDPEQVAIMLGINYVGWLDDLRIYSKPLTGEQIKQLAGEEN